MKSINLYFIFTILILLFWGCSNEHAADHHDEEEALSTAITLWEDDFELFMEYPVPEVNEPGKCIIHLTRLSDFSAITDGSVCLNFTDKTGKVLTVESDQLLREGIFTPEVEFKSGGEYNFTLTYKNAHSNKTFNIGKINVYLSHDDIIHAEEAPDHRRIRHVKYWRRRNRIIYCHSAIMWVAEYCPSSFFPEYAVSP